MSQVKTVKPGQFCWVEVATDDPDRTAKFYDDLFGWERTDIPMPHGTYSMLGNEEVCAAGMFQLDETMREAGVSPHWMSYLEVEDLDSSTARAEQLGGKIVKGPEQAGEHGRFSIISDPTGATFSLWQTQGSSPRPFAKNRMGTLDWNELITSDPAAASHFYCELFGWTATGVSHYKELYKGNAQVGGLMAIPETWPEQSFWLIYFAVSDCLASLKLLEANGGQIMVQPQSLDEVGTFAVVTDPGGAKFAIIQPPL